MSLVAYGSCSSDESGDDDETTIVSQLLIQKDKKHSLLNLPVQKPSTLIQSRPTSNELQNTSPETTNISKGLFNTTAAASKSFLKNLPRPKYVSVSEEPNKQKQSDSTTGSSLFSSLPAPKSRNLDLLDIECNESVATSQSSIKKVKITLPPLSQFKDIDDSEPSKKKPKPSTKGSGLFSLLPPPKNLTVKETKRAFVPHVLTKKPSITPVKAAPAPMVQTAKTKPSLELISYGYPDSGDDTEEESETPRDFFSLHKTDDVVELGDSVASVSTSVNGTEKVIECEDEVVFNDEPLAFVSGFRPSPWANNQPNPERPSTAEQSTSHEFSETEDYLSVVEDDLQLDDEALQRLCGRRTKKQDVEFINVNGAEIMPDPKEWLVKQLSQEQPTMRSHSHKKNDGPTSQQRRKHQITYLAFQAKENELELKNQWSQNRMSRKQTQSKYGF